MACYARTYFFLLFMFTAASVQAQLFGGPYANEYTLTPFEEHSFYFQPQALTHGPGGVFTGSEQALPATLMSRVAFNPAALGRVPEGRLIFSTRVSTLPTEEINVGSNTTCPTVNCASVRPWSSTIERRPAEPLFSAAGFYRAEGSRFGAGFTWQVHHSRQNYYGTLRPLNFGSLDELYPLTFIHTSFGITGPQQPRTDRLHTAGHFPSLLLSLQLSPSITAGMRAGLGFYNTSGELRSGIADEPAPGSDSHHSLNRSQNYRHAEVMAGLEFTLSERLTAGAAAGWLRGRASQQENHIHDQSLYNLASLTGTQPQFREAEQAEQGEWNRTGSTWTGRADVSYAISENTTYRAWFGSSVNLQDADVHRIQNHNWSSGESYTSSDGTEYYSTHYSRWRFDNNGTGSVRSRTHLAGAQAIQQLHRSAELIIGFTINGNRRISESDDLQGYSFNNISRVERPQDNDSDSFFGLNEYDRIWRVEFDRRELNYNLPVSLSIRIFSSFTAIATVMPEWRRWRTEICRTNFLTENEPQTQLSPTVRNLDDSARTLNGKLTLGYTPRGGTVISVTGITNRSEVFTGNISQPSRFRLTANLKVLF